MEHLRDLKKTYRTSLIIYGAFIVSLLIYLFLFEILKARIPDFQGVMGMIDLPWLRYAFYALGLVQIFLIKFIRDTSARRVTTIDARILINHLNKISVVSAALCEVPVVLGWVLFFLSGNVRDFYVLFAMSCVFFALFFPRYTNWEEWIKSKTSH